MPSGVHVLLVALLAVALLAPARACAEGNVAPAVDVGGMVTTDHGVSSPLGPTDGVDLSPTDLDRVKPGEVAPDFTLEDQNGLPVTLSGFRGHRPVVLVFYRGHW